MSFTQADGYEVYLDSMCECTFCPPNTKQCAHLDGYWVRLTNPSVDGVPAVAWNFGFPDSESLLVRQALIERTTWTMFYHLPSSLSDAKDDFHKRDAEMRKIASRG